MKSISINIWFISKTFCIFAVERRRNSAKKKQVSSFCSRLFVTLQTFINPKL